MKLRKHLVANFMVAVLMLSTADVTVLAVEGQQGMEGVLQESEVQASVESQKDEKNFSGETDEKKISETERTGASADEEQPEGEAPDNENLADDIEEENKDEETVSGNEMFDEEEKAEEDTISSNGIEESLSADGASAQAVITATVQDGSGVSGTCKVTVSSIQNVDQPETPDDSEGVIKEDIPEGGVPQGLWISAIAEQEYTGKAIKPDVRVYDGDKRLVPGKDYTISYKNNVKAASESTANAPVVTIKGKGNYSGTEKKGFTITSKNICDIDVIKSFTNAYALPTNHKNPKLVFVAKYNNRALTINRDYTLTIKDNRGLAVYEFGTEGAYWLVVEGRGNYTGTLEFVFEVSDKTPVSMLKVNKIAAMEYTGKDLEPKPIVKDGATVLTEGTDYRVIYSANSKAGKVTVSFIGMGRYVGTLKKTYQITAYNINRDAGSRIHWQEENIEIPYCKGGVKPKIKLYDGTKLLIEGTDYTLSYKNNKVVAAASVEKRPEITVKGKGNYTGVWYQRIPFTIFKRNIDEVSIAVSDVEVSTEVGKYKPTLILTDTDGKKLDASYRIVKKSINKAKITVMNPEMNNRNQFAYTGRKIIIEKKNLIVNVNGVELSADQYEILEDTYKNNQNKGTASVQIRGLGDYGGTATVKYKIVTQGFRWAF